MQTGGCITERTYIYPRRHDRMSGIVYLIHIKSVGAIFCIRLNDFFLPIRYNFLITYIIKYNSDI